MSAPRILFFGLDYHGYTQALRDEMQRAGYAVTFVDLEPRSPLAKALRTVQPRMYARLQRTRLDRAIAAATGQRLARVIFLQAHQMKPEQLGRLRGQHPQTPFILYNWDSLKTQDYRPQARYFDRVMTFDATDAADHGFEYLPLFAIRFIQDLRQDRADAKTVAMIGNIVTARRYRAVQDFRAYCQVHGLTFRSYLKISPVVWLRLLRQGILPRDVRFVDISQAQMTNLIETAAAMFDFANHEQSGFTMRTMESLCAGKKIITNNPFIRDAPFYTEDRIHVFSGSDFGDVTGFLRRPLTDPDARFSEHHIQRFVQHLLGPQ